MVWALQHVVHGASNLRSHAWFNVSVDAQCEAGIVMPERLADRQRVLASDRICRWETDARDSARAGHDNVIDDEPGAH